MEQELLLAGILLVIAALTTSIVAIIRSTKNNKYKE